VHSPHNYIASKEIAPCAAAASITFEKVEHPLCFTKLLAAIKVATMDDFLI